jgi:uncharacterized membrane protein (DUF373 family)
MNEKLLTRIVSRIELYIIKTLIGLMTLLLILATIQLGYYVVISIMESQTFIIELDVIMDLFGVFLLVLIGIELLDTIKVYFKKHDIHVEVVLLVALIAIARKVILLDFNYYSGTEVFSIAAVIIALAIGYYFIKKSGGAGFWPEEKGKIKDIIIEEKEFDPKEKTKVMERKKTLKEQSTTKPVDEPGEPSSNKDSKSDPVRKNNKNKDTPHKPT